MFTGNSQSTFGKHGKHGKMVYIYKASPVTKMSSRRINNLWHKIKQRIVLRLETNRNAVVRGVLTRTVYKHSPNGILHSKRSCIHMKKIIILNGIVHMFTPNIDSPHNLWLLIRTKTRFRHSQKSISHLVGVFLFRSVFVSIGWLLSFVLFATVFKYLCCPLQGHLP